MPVNLVLPDADRTRALGRSLGAVAELRALVALTGPLGAGKTCLVQGVGEGLNVYEQVNSPTFTMLNEYHSGRLPLFHLDLYRLKDDPVTRAALGGDSLELLRAELDEIAAGPGIIIIEWAEFILPYLPPDHLLIEISLASGGESRQATLTAGGPGSAALLEKVARAQAARQ